MAVFSLYIKHLYWFGCLKVKIGIFKATSELFIANLYISIAYGILINFVSHLKYIIPPPDSILFFFNLGPARTISISNLNLIFINYAYNISNMITADEIQ